MSSKHFKIVLNLRKTFNILINDFLEIKTIMFGKNKFHLNKRNLKKIIENNIDKYCFIG
jgi:hypothetical protein